MVKYNLGLAIFATIAITSIASSWIPRLRGMMFNRKRKSKRDDDKPQGDLIVVGSSRFKSNFWKFLSSSDHDNEDCDIEIINDSNETYLLCWVRPDGSLSNYYPINDGSIRDGSVSNRHGEGTATNHVFVCIRPSPNLPKHIADIDPSHFIFSYRPLLPDIIHVIQLKKSNTNEIEINLSYNETDKEIIDTSNKIYDRIEIRGFTIFYEPNLSSSMPELFTTLNLDLEMVCKLLPKEACLKLQKDTYFWINENLTYGTESKPVIGREMCFHPSGGWLKANGMNVAKAGCIEMYQAKHYLDGRDLWGPGGLLVHELSHAYHCKHCKLFIICFCC